MTSQRTCDSWKPRSSFAQFLENQNQIDIILKQQQLKTKNRLKVSMNHEVLEV